MSTDGGPRQGCDKFGTEEMSSSEKKSASAVAKAGNDTDNAVVICRGDVAGEWDAYVAAHPERTFAHRFGWSAVLAESFGIEPYYFAAQHQDTIVGVLPTALMKSLLFGKFLISLPWLDYGGPLADSDEIAGQLVEAAAAVAAKAGCRFLEMRTVRRPLTGLVEKTDKREFWLDLTPGEDAVWKSFDAKNRNQVRKAEKSGLQVSFGGLELLDDFYRVFATNMRDLGTPVWPKSLFTGIFRYFPDDTEFAVVKLDNTTIAAALLLHYQKHSAVPSASAYRKYLNLCPNNILYWEIIKHCLRRGSTVFDFGRSTEGAGTYRFKKQWVETPKNQVWQYRLLTIDSLPELNPGNPKFKLAINIWQRLPLPLANFLGPKIVTKLP
jgi:serine/alanine adding enzyme